MQTACQVVLVVDDSEMNRNLLDKVLTNSGYQVLLAEDGREALDVLTNQYVDLVLLDMLMPVLNGLDTLQELRTTHTAAELPVIMVSGAGNSDQVVEALTHGANDYITKPFDVNVTLARVANHIRRKEESAESARLEKKPELGKMLGHYRLEAELGSGGMGTVYRALDTRLDRRVAVKVLKSGFQETGVARFVQEARAGARLSHPAIAHIYEIATNPVPFIAMEWVDGTNLDVHLKNQGGEPNLRNIVNLIAQVAEILSLIHSANIVHRDLKPSNLMVDRGGRVHLMDFGLAKLLEIDAGLTKTGEILGTPAYMAPEQVDANAFGGPDHQTDIYALGILLYECLSGRFPYRTRPLCTLLYDVLFKEPDPPGTVWPELDAVCLRAIAKQKHERYGSAYEFRQALLGLLANSARLAS